MGGFKGTLGKWIIELEPGHQNMILNEDKDRAIAFVPQLHPQCKENTQLISAAPELLAACMEFIRKVESGEARSKRSYAQMKEAVNKALGET